MADKGRRGRGGSVNAFMGCPKISSALDFVPRRLFKAISLSFHAVTNRRMGLPPQRTDAEDQPAFSE